jgi:hypothetical protein
LLSQIVEGCFVPMWQRWQSIGDFATSIRSLDEPCGSWQLSRLSRPAACSKRNGPRFSVWHDAAC